MENIRLSDLQGDQRELAELIGIDNYIKVVQKYGGTSIYIAKTDKLLNVQRDLAIIKEFNGRNYRYLACKYRLSERTVRDIIAREYSKDIPTQISLFDDS